MSQPTIEAYGFELPLVNKPANLQEFIDTFGVEKAFEYADRYRTYHIIANGARDAVLDAIEKVTGVKPKTKMVEGKKKEDGSAGDPVEIQDEGDGKYVNRALAEFAQAQHEGDMDKARAAIVSEGKLSEAVVDYSKEPERRSAGPKKLGVNVTKRAQAIHAKGPEAVSKTISGLTSYLPEGAHPKDVEPGEDGSYSVESVAKWLAAFDKHEEEEKNKKEKALAGLAS